MASCVEAPDSQRSTRVAATSGTGRFSDPATTRGFTTEKLSEDIQRSGCTNPIHCIQAHETDLRRNMPNPMRTMLWANLKENRFFDRGEEDDPALARQMEERVELESGGVNHDRVHNLLKMVEEKTRKLPLDKRYDHEGPLVLFLCALARSEDADGVEVALKLRNTITDKHKCCDHRQAESPPRRGKAKGKRQAAAGVMSSASGSPPPSTGQLKEMDPVEFKLKVVQVLEGADSEGFDCKQITRMLQGIDLVKGNCDSDVKKKVNQTLSALDKENQAAKSDVKHQSLPCWKLVE